MSNRVVIIPSATFVPEELQYLGKLPAIIYPINQKIVFDYLLERYRGADSQIKIICGMGAEKVHQRLAKHAMGREVILEDLPEVRDLGYTIWFGIREIDDPIVINFSDTIVEDDALRSKGDAFFYSEDFPSEKWTFFREAGGRIAAIFDKTEVPCGGKEREKLFVGVFQIKHTAHFRKCLENALAAERREMSSFYCALREYSETYPLEAVKTERWFDIGHADKYLDFGLEVKAREFNHITIDKYRGILRKTSANKEKFIGEIKWYLKLPGEIEYVRPRIFDYSLDYVAPYVAMEYYSYHTLHELYLHGDLARYQWAEIFNRIRFVCDDFRKYRIAGAELRDSLEDMYLNKTMERMDALRREPRFQSFFAGPIRINGRKMRGLNEVCDMLRVRIPSLLCDVKEFSIIHGDLCFSNIMVDSSFSFIKLIDPRGKFGKYDIYGDFRYELAKLVHSIDGKYDYIIKNLFDLQYSTKDASIAYKMQTGGGYDLYAIFKEVFKEEIGEDLEKIELIEALLFLSMIPLHSESLEQQLVMLATGLEILNRIILIEEDRGDR